MKIKHPRFFSWFIFWSLKRADQQIKQALATHDFLPIICPDIFLAVRFNQKPKTVKEEETCMFPG